MSRMARVVAPGYPHHITQRGNRRQKTFFNDGDFKLYLQLMKEWCDKCGVEIWSYCLMPNHTHLVAKRAPPDEDCQLDPRVDQCDAIDLPAPED